MFTGIVETTGVLHDRQRQGEAGKLWIRTALAAELTIGSSIAVNGTCLSVEKIDQRKKLLQFHTLAQTLDRTNLGVVPVGHKVNLERPLKLGDLADSQLHELVFGLQPIVQVVP